jgi:hypothetical protein
MSVSTNTLFSDKQILKVAGPDTKLITYPQLQRFSTIDQVFGNKNKVIILYIHTETQNNISGHWCAIIRHSKYIEFYDSYGMMPDDIIIMKSPKDRKDTRQDHNYLSILLYESKTPVQYNEYPYQEVNDNINTCGAHTGVRCRFSDIDLTDYQHIFNTLKSHGVDTDKIVVELAKLFL